LRARKYDKKIQIWHTQKSSDGYSGYTIQDELLTTIWCKIDTLNANSKYNNTSNQFGTLDVSNSVRLLFRKRNDLTFNAKDMFFVYRGYKYIINNSPININFLDNEVEIIATRETAQQKSDGLYNVYSDYSNRVVLSGGIVSSKDCTIDTIKTMMNG